MFSIEYLDEQKTIKLSGNFDSSRAAQCKEVLEKIDHSVTVDMKDLAYICSAGIGILVMTYRRLKELNEKIVLVNLNEHIKKVFEISLLDSVFEIK